MIEPNYVCDGEICTETAEVASSPVSNQQVLVEIYSDVICPWCFVGKRRFEQGLAQSGLSAEDVHVVWKPFQLNPSMPEHGVERNEYRPKKFGSLEYSQRLDEQIKTAGTPLGLEFNYERVQRTPNTRKAHLLLQVANAAGKQDAVAEALFLAYFTDGRDIGDEATLIEIAQNAGISKSEVDSAFADAAQQQQLRDELEQGAKLNIHSVPTFVINGTVAFAGAQNPETIADVLRGAKQTKEYSNVAAVAIKLEAQKTMTLESLRLARNFLLRSAALCYGFLILSALIWLPLSSTWTGLTSSLYHVTPEMVNDIVVTFLSVAKFYAIFFLLVPGLALHWTLKREESRKVV